MTVDSESASATRAPALVENAPIILAVLVFVFGLAIALSNLSNGPWMDEFNTLVTTLRGHSPAVFFEHVVRGQHPLLYEGVVYLAQATGVTDIAGLRLINLLGLPLVFGATWISLRRGALSGAQAAVVIALYGSSGNLLSYLASVRPYFLMFSASIAAVLMWRLMLRAEPRKAPLGLWAGALAVLVNVHYFGTIFGGLLTLALLIDRLTQKRAREMLAIAAASLLAAAPALVLGLLQYSYTSGGGVLYYYPAGVDYALVSFRDASWAAIAGNFVAGPCAIVALITAIRHGALARDYRDVLTLAGVGLAFFLLLLAMHQIKPMIYDRYLIAASGALLVGVAVLSAGPAAPRYAPFAVIAFALVVQASFLAARQSAFNWSPSAQQVRNIVRNCPSATVYGVPYARVNNGPIWTTPLNPTESEARSYGYRYYAQQLGFAVTADLAPGDVIAAPGACPAVVWIEHFWPGEKTAADLLAKLRLTAPADAYFGQVGSGILLIAPGHPS
jgi:hypothetical protein